jgi:hypothetical protein
MTNPVDQSIPWSRLHAGDDASLMATTEELSDPQWPDTSGFVDLAENRGSVDAFTVPERLLVQPVTI